jgi:hypothetical protein
MNYSDDIQELREIIDIMHEDELCILRGLLEVQQMIYQCRDYTEISEGIAKLIRLHDPTVIDKAEEMGAEL